MAFGRGGGRVVEIFNVFWRSPHTRAVDEVVVFWM